jgi:hypothetical protein
MPPINETHKALDAYYADPERLRAHGVTNEQGLQPAFQHLLETLDKPVGWTLVPQQALPLSRRLPDGTLFDEFHFPRGYWEARTPTTT